MRVFSALVITGLLYPVVSGRGYRVVDLTHKQDVNTIYWPGNPDYNFTILARGPSGNGWCIQTAEHGGTHVDAPSHFAQAKYRMEDISMEKLVGPGVIINVKEKVLIDPDYRVSVQDLTDWEVVHGRIPNDAIVIMNSGWTDKYPIKTQTFGTPTPDNASTFHFPGFHEDSADWLVKHRNVHAVGVDTPSMDYGQSTTYTVHVILARANIPGIENVANLDAIPESGAMVFVAPIKLNEGSGAPARVFATINDSTSSSATLRSTNVLLSVLIATHYACSW